MRIIESLPPAEYIEHTPDVLIVHGKNIGVGSTVKDIRADVFNLSPESRMNVIAAGMLYRPGMDIIFSSGHTAGNDILSEAQAMKNYCQLWFPDIPEEKIILEEKSIDTSGNAEEVARIVAQKGYKHVGLVTVGYHLTNAGRLFAEYGVPVEFGFASEVIEAQLSAYHRDKMEDWKTLPRIKQEYQKEKVRGLLLLTVDKKGTLLRRIAEKTRK